ncbi:hypothetical protein [Amaricoccus sp. B4]|uniref:hypothetical protein n=1 Tax=Amaricoccus sp. B4 TaxID=3368557 RepID=UPI003722C34B
MNHGLINVLRLNLRKSKQVIGDLFSLAACSHAWHKRLIELLDVIAVANCAEADHLQRPDGDRAGGRRGDPARVRFRVLSGGGKALRRCSGQVRLSCGSRFLADAGRVRGCDRAEDALAFPQHIRLPVGRIFSREELEALGAVLAKYPQILFPSDEIQVHIIFDNREFVSSGRLARAEGASQRARPRFAGRCILYL